MPQPKLTRQARERIQRVTLEDLSGQTMRGRVNVTLYRSEPGFMYADLRLGNRIARTPLMDQSEVALMIKDVCNGLGFIATVTEECPDDFTDE